MKSKIVLAVAFSTVLLTGCITPDDPNRSTKIGAGIGVVAGAVIGKQLGGDKGRTIGAVIGGGTGALIGYDKDKQRQDLARDLANDKDADVSETPDGEIKVNLDSEVSFAFGSATIQPGFRATLNTIAQSLASYPSTTARIVGHTDSVGSTQSNQALSQQRADAVASYLIYRGIPASRLSTYGAGEHQPIASNNSDFGRAQNRRVEIFISQ